MAKQIVATMLVKHDGVKYQIDDVMDPQLFTKEQLTRLYERGAVKVVDESELKAKKEENAKALDDIMNNKTKTQEQAEKEAAERKKLEEANAARKAELEAEAAKKAKEAEEAKKAAAAKIK